MKYLACCIALFLGTLFPASAQTRSDLGAIRNLRIQTGTELISWEKDRIQTEQGVYLPLPVSAPTVEADVWITPRADSSFRYIQLVESAQAKEVSPPAKLVNGTYSLRVRWQQVFQGALPAITLKYLDASPDTQIVSISLLPQVMMQVSLSPGPKVIYLGERQQFPLQTNLPANIRLQREWTTTPTLAYRIIDKEGVPTLEVTGLKAGNFQPNIPLGTYRPVVENMDAEPVSLSLLPFDLTIKKGRLPLIPMTPDIVELSREDRTTEIEVRFSRQLSLSLGNTYRLESRESAGGMFIGELYIKEITSSGQMIASVRAYTYHKRDAGPVYLKTLRGETKLITQLDIVPTPRVQEVWLRRKKQDWTTDLTVKPGETVELKITGESLRRSSLTLAELGKLLPLDSTAYTSKELLTQVNIPTSIAVSALPVQLGGVDLPFILKVEEYQRPVALKTLAALLINKRRWRLDKVRNPQKLPEELSSLVLEFNRDSIDMESALYGPQYLDIEVEMVDQEYKRIGQVRKKEICLCPTDESPRPKAYGALPCFDGNLSIPDMIDIPLDEYPAWANIRVRISHRPTIYGKATQVEELNLVVTRTLDFSLQVAFPIGILMNRFDGTGNEALRSINLGTFLEVGVFKQKGINKLVPVRFSVGLMATDAFNFRGEPRRDLGVTGLFSIHPVDQRKRWDIPLYLGGGFLIDNQTGFFFMGPGVTLSF